MSHPTETLVAEVATLLARRLVPVLPVQRECSAVDSLYQEHCFTYFLYLALMAAMREDGLDVCILGGGAHICAHEYQHIDCHAK